MDALGPEQLSHCGSLPIWSVMEWHSYLRQGPLSPPFDQKGEFSDLPQGEGKNMRDSHGVVTRLLEQLMFCADTGRRARGT